MPRQLSAGTFFPGICRTFFTPPAKMYFIYPHFPQYPQWIGFFGTAPVFAILSISFAPPLCYNRLSFENGKSGDDINNEQQLDSFTGLSRGNDYAIKPFYRRIHEGCQ